MDTKRALLGLPGLLLLASLQGGCTVAPPVQEMSDARQAIHAAIEVDARELAPATLQEAERLVDTATQNLEHGNYEAARRAAIAARKQAMQARDQAVTGRSNL